MIAALHLPQNLRSQIEREALAALPRECCGLIEGVRENAGARATAVHATRNLAEESDQFEIDPAEQFQLIRRLRGTSREIIGCYHSHPNGRAEPSPRDLSGAVDEEFLWLIARVEAGRADVQAYLCREGVFARVPLAA